MPVENLMPPTLTEIVAARKTVRTRARTASVNMPSASRVAEVFLAKKASAGYDHLVRALILEGAAQIRPLTWANNNASQNLIKAKKRLMAEHPSMDLSWFGRKNTGAWRNLENRVQKVFRSNGLAEDDAMDILHRALYGLTKNNAQGAIPLWKAGQNLMDGILSGSETPKSVTIGLAGKWFVRKAISEIKTLRRREEDHGTRIDVHDDADRLKVERKVSFAKAFMDLVTDPASRVGRGFRGFVQRVFEGTTQEAVGQAYYDYLFTHGSTPKKRDIAHITGKSEQSVGQHIKAISGMLVKALRANQPLLKVLETAIRDKGADFPDYGVFLKLFDTSRVASRVAKPMHPHILAEVQTILAG